MRRSNSRKSRRIGRENLPNLSRNSSFAVKAITPEPRDRAQPMAETVVEEKLGCLGWFYRLFMPPTCPQCRVGLMIAVDLSPVDGIGSLVRPAAVCNHCNYVSGFPVR